MTERRLFADELEARLDAVLFASHSHRSATGIAEGLAALCRERLAAYKVPKKVDLRSALPLLPIGKVDKKQLRNLVA